VMGANPSKFKGLKKPRRQRELAGLHELRGETIEESAGSGVRLPNRSAMGIRL